MEAIVIRHSITAAAARERVWKAITTPASLSRWFAPLSMTFEALTVGQQMAFTYEGKTTYGAIAAVEPPTLFAFRWPADPDYDIQNLVTFILDETEGGTRITVTEEGFEALPEQVRQTQFENNTHGWTIVLERAKTYAEDTTQS